MIPLCTVPEFRDETANFVIVVFCVTKTLCCCNDLRDILDRDSMK